MLSLWTGAISPFWPFIDYKLTLGECQEISFTGNARLAIMFLKIRRTDPSGRAV